MLRASSWSHSKRFETTEKLYISKTNGWHGGRIYTPHLSILDPPLAITYRNHQKSLAYFSHLAPSLILFFCTERQSEKGGGMAKSRAYIPEGMHPPNIFRGGDDNAFITPNNGTNCYAIAIQHSMSGDGWQGCKSMLSIGG